MANTTISWIAVPNGLTSDRARVSILVSPVFEPGAEQDPAFAFFRWTTVVKNGGGQFRLFIGSNPPLSVTADISLLFPELWEAVFGLPPADRLTRSSEALAQAQATMLCSKERSLSDIQNTPVHTYSAQDWFDSLNKVYRPLLTRSSARGSSRIPLFSDALASSFPSVEWFRFDGAKPEANLLISGDAHQEVYDRMLARLTTDPLNELSIPLVRALNTIHNEATDPKRGRLQSGDFSTQLARIYTMYARVPRLGLAHTDADLKKEDETQGLRKSEAQITSAQRILMVKQFPTLLRPLGLVLDIADIDLSTLSNDDDISISVAPSWSVPGSIENHSPTTLVHAPKTAFRLKESSNGTLPPLVENGMLNPSRLHCKTLDLVAAAFKTVSFVSTLNAKRDLSIANVSKPKFAANDVLPSRPPSLKSTGITIYMDERALQARLDMDRSLEISVSADQDVKYTADDLRFGYVVYGRIKSRRDGTSGSWMSLCERRERYQCANGLSWSPSGPQQGTIRFLPTKPLDKTTAQATPPDSRELHEDVLTIEQQHLTAAQNGDPVLEPSRFQTENQNTTPPTDYHKVTLVTEAVGDVLGKRFGFTYEFTFPVIDLAGNLRWDLENISKAGSELATTEQKLLRYEPLSPPNVLADPGFQVGDGESLDHVVLRNGDGQNVRWLIPPKVDFYFAQWHGMFDWLLSGEGNTPEGFDGIRFKDDGDFWRTKENVPVYLHPGQPGSTYYPDPMARRIYAELHDPLGDGPQGINPVELFVEETWWPTNLRPVKFQVTGSNADSARITADASLITVSVPKAHVVTVDLRCTFAPLPRNPSELAAHDINAHGLCEWMNSGELEDVSMGLNDIICPSHRIVITNAVEKPLHCEFKSAATSRSRGQTKTVFQAEMEIDYRSTGKIKVDATWRDPTPNLDKPEGHDSRPGMVHIGEQTTGQPMSNAPATFGFKCLFDAGSTKHRVLTVYAVAETSFRGFYPPTSDSNPEDKYTEQAKLERIELLNSGIPAPAKLLYAVPAFDRMYCKQTDGSITRVTKGGIVRVYLDDSDRFDTGEGELYGLAICPSNLAPKSCGAPGSELSKILPFITRFAPDSISAAQTVDSGIPVKQDFSEYAAYSDDVRLQETGQRVGVVGYQPRVHEAFAGQKLWYFDAVLNRVPTYGSFLKMMLVRFQPSSVEGCHISAIASIEFAQLSNDRSIIVRRIDSHTLRVTISGKPNPASGHALGNTMEVLVFKQSHNGPRRWVIDNEAVVSPAGPQNETADGPSLWTGTVRFQDHFTSTAGPRKIAVKEVRRILPSHGSQPQESIVYADLFTGEDSW